MLKYNYYRVKSLQDLSEQLTNFGNKAKIIAGGTDIMVQIYENDKKWKDLECLLDISSIKDEMSYIKEDGDKIHIGALSSHTDISKSDIINKYLQPLAKACNSVGSPQIRNMGTVGGSICNASPASDPLPPMILAGTTVVIHGKDGTREVDLQAFYLERGKTDLNAGEFVKEFIVNKIPDEMRSEFVKLGRRKALAISRLNVATGVLLDNDNKIVEARIAPGCIFVNPERVTRAEQLLIGQTPSSELFKKAGKVVAEVMIEKTGVRWSTEYKQPAVEGIIEESLLRTLGMEV